MQINIWFLQTIKLSKELSIKEALELFTNYIM